MSQSDLAALLNSVHDFDGYQTPDDIADFKSAMAEVKADVLALLTPEEVVEFFSTDLFGVDC